MKQNPVTKTELNEILDERFSEFKNDIFDRLDNIAGQLETIRQEQILAYGQHKELEERVDNHGKRISVLESPQT